MSFRSFLKYTFNLFYLRFNLISSPLFKPEGILIFFALVSKQSAVLSSATQHAMPSELSEKWGTECLNTRFPLPTLLCAGYSVKLILIFNPTKSAEYVSEMN